MKKTAAEKPIMKLLKSYTRLYLAGTLSLKKHDGT